MESVSYGDRGGERPESSIKEYMNAPPRDRFGGRGGVIFYMGRFVHVRIGRAAVNR